MVDARTLTQVATHQTSEVAEQLEISDEQLQRLSELSEQISIRIKDLLIKRNTRQASDILKGPERCLGDDPAFAEWLGKAYEIRRNRILFLGADGLFGEPAWDMILDIAYHQLQSRPVSVKSACISSNVPASTALRYLNKLEESGDVLRVNDAKDRRRDFVILSGDFMERLYRLYIVSV